MAKMISFAFGLWNVTRDDTGQRKKKIHLHICPRRLGARPRRVAFYPNKQGGFHGVLFFGAIERFHILCS